MKQPMHIVAKDFRHYWPEWAVSLALILGFARRDVQSWQLPSGGVVVGGGWFVSSDFLWESTAFLLPVAWMLLIVRAIQDEPPVGDRQFWVTRPYEWNKLLAAKVFFVLAAINLPLLLLDCFLLRAAGFAITPHLAGLLWMQVLISIFFFLPVAALATVTATLAQLGLAVLLVLLYFIGASYLVDKIPSARFSSAGDSLTGALYLATCVFVVPYQYARRRTAQSRGAILGLALIVLAGSIVTPYQKLIAREYPKIGPGEQPPVQLALLPPPQARQSRYGSRGENEVLIVLPLRVAGVANNSFVIASGQMVELSANGGTRWDSGWISSGDFLFPSQKQTRLYFSMKKRLFEQLRSLPVALRISMALTSYDQGRGRELLVPAGWFDLPEVGLCSAQPPTFARRIHCLAPLRKPRSLLVSSELSATTCEPLSEETPPPAGERGYGWIHSNTEGPAEFGISPIKEVEVSLGHFNRPPSPTQKSPLAAICPGTPIRLSTPSPTRRTMIELVFKDIRLIDYQPVD